MTATATYRQMKVKPLTFGVAMFIGAWALMLAVGVLHHRGLMDWTLSYWEAFLVRWGIQACWPTSIAVSTAVERVR